MTPRSATPAGRRPKGSAGVASYLISEVTEGPFKGKFTVSRGDVVNAVFGTRAAAKRYVAQHAAAQVPSR